MSGNASLSVCGSTGRDGFALPPRRERIGDRISLHVLNSPQHHRGRPEVRRIAPPGSREVAARSVRRPAPKSSLAWPSLGYVPMGGTLVATAISCNSAWLGVRNLRHGPERAGRET